MRLSEDARRKLLSDAVDAVRAWIGHDIEAEPTAEPTKVGVVHKPVAWGLEEAARRAVTRAVTEGGHIHTLITVQVGCPGMRVVRLIADRDAYAKALVVERNAAQNYMAQIMDATRVEALRRLGGEEKQVIAERLNVSRPTLNEWERKSSQDA